MQVEREAFPTIAIIPDNSTVYRFPFNNQGFNGVGLTVTDSSKSQIDDAFVAFIKLDGQGKGFEMLQPFTGNGNGQYLTSVPYYAAPPRNATQWNDLTL